MLASQVSRYNRLALVELEWKIDTSDTYNSYGAAQRERNSIFCMTRD